jgi:hypothetical protein
MTNMVGGHIKGKLKQAHVAGLAVQNWWLHHIMSKQALQYFGDVL